MKITTIKLPQNTFFCPETKLLNIEYLFVTRTWKILSDVTAWVSRRVEKWFVNLEKDSTGVKIRGTDTFSRGTGLPPLRRMMMLNLPSFYRLSFLTP